MKKLIPILFFPLLFSSNHLSAQADDMGEAMFGWSEAHLDWPMFQTVADTFNLDPQLSNYLEKPDYLKGLWYRMGMPFNRFLWWHGVAELNAARYKAIESDTLGNEIAHWNCRTGSIGLGLGLEIAVINTKPFRFTIGANGEMTNLHTDVKRGSERWQTKNGNFILMTRAYCDLQFGSFHMLVIEPFISTSAWKPGLYNLANYFASDYAADHPKSFFRQRPVFIGLTVAFGVRQFE